MTSAGDAVRHVLAPNASPMTLDGTRTYLVGRAAVAVIDPGPDRREHLDAVLDAASGRVAAILLTHSHPDHAAGADSLAARARAPVLAHGAGTLRDGHRIDTDAGALVAVHSPGHTPDHVAFHWAEGGAVFCGDLMMGGMDTALVASPEGNLTQYLASLERLRLLGARLLVPAHGPPFDDPPSALDRYVAHRRERQQQVLSALAAGPLDEDTLVAAVYGDALAAELRDAALGAVRAYLEHLVLQRRIERTADGRWVRSGAATEG